MVHSHAGGEESDKVRMFFFPLTAKFSIFTQVLSFNSVSSIDGFEYVYSVYSVKIKKGFISCNFFINVPLINIMYS